jgi:anthraniloyl-CoA monooxygenase
MRIVSIGAGPAALYFGILMKKAMPEADITLVERNQADDTFGWGVVFSEETLDNFDRADPESMARIKKSFRFWGDIETFVSGTTLRSTGHGFCGLSRKTLLFILQERAAEIDVKRKFSG